MANNPYTQPTMTGYNSSPPADDGTEVAANQLNWSKHKTKLGDPVKNFATDMDANVLTAFGKTINTDDTEQNSLQGSLAFVSDTLTIAAGSVTPDRSHHSVDTEAAASTDDLDTITTGSVADETILYLNSVSAARVVSVRDGVGNINLARTEASTEIDLDPNRPLVLIRDGTDWYQVEAIADKIESRNAGATGAPDLTLYRNSASPAAADVMGRILFNGEDSAGNEETYAHIDSRIVDPTSGSEDSALDFYTEAAGASAANMILAGTSLTIIGTAKAGTITIGSGSVTDSSGAISFGNENLTTTGNLAAANGTFTGTLAAGTASPDYKAHVLSTATDVANFESSAAAANIWLQDSGSTDNKSVGIGSVGDAMDLYAGGAAVLTLATGGTISGTIIASAAEADAGTATGLIVTPEGLEESRKRFRAQTTDATTTITMTATMAGGMIRTTATAAVTFTVPQDTMTANDVVYVFQEAAGQVTMTGGGSVTFSARNGAKTAAADALISLYFLTANTAVISGDSAA